VRALVQGEFLLVPGLFAGAKARTPNPYSQSLISSEHKPKLFNPFQAKISGIEVAAPRMTAI
jgi:hypothetical protein